MITDRIRFTVIEVNTNNVLARDLIVKEPSVTINLSAPSRTAFSIDQSQRYGSAEGIEWKNWGQWIIPEIHTDTHGTIVMGAQLVTDNKIDPESGDMQIDAMGFMGYPKGIPWLENYNPIAIDPAEIVQRIWAHIQNFPHANLGVLVEPALFDLELLPGYGFDGSILSFDFFAIFVRAIEFTDSGDMIASLARDLPFDMVEKVEWNPGGTEVTKTLEMAYPLGGVQQDNLTFRLGENVLNAERAEEMDIEPVSDIIVRGWRPGKVYTNQLSNLDETRARRVAMEEDVNINSNERAAAWNQRKLTRRNVPKYFSKITIDPNHPNALFGSFTVGDSIYVEADDFPWTGDIAEWHRVLSITVKDDEPFVELGLKVEGAFNYDPIIYDPNYDEERAPVDPNLLSNGYFTTTTAGWYPVKGQWIRIGTEGYEGAGCVRIDCDDNGEEFRSEKITVTSGQQFEIQAVVRGENITVSGASPYTFAISVQKYYDGAVWGDPPEGPTVVDSISTTGVFPFQILSGSYTVPAYGPEAPGEGEMSPTFGTKEISLSLIVHSAVSGGVAYWDDARVLP